MKLSQTCTCEDFPFDEFAKIRTAMEENFSNTIQ